MKISVIIPVYNAKDTVSKAIESMIEQDFDRNYEIIVVDDGSTDGTTETLNSLAHRHPMLRIYRTTHRGIAKSLNYAVKLSTGKYIARMDADDYSHPERLQRQHDFLEANPDIGLVSCLVKYQGSETDKGYSKYVDWTNELTAADDILNRRFQESPFAHPSVMFRRHLCLKHGGYSESKIPEDYELWLRWMHQGIKMAKLNRYLLEWSDSDDRLSRTDPNYEQNQFFKLKARYLQLHLQEHFAQHVPDIYIWGAGRIVNKRVSYLEDRGITIKKYIDVKENDDPRFIHFKKLPKPGKILVLSYVSDWKGKLKIREYLNQHRYTEGKDFFMMA